MLPGPPSASGTEVPWPYSPGLWVLEATRVCLRSMEEGQSYKSSVSPASSSTCTSPFKMGNRARAEA